MKDDAMGMAWNEPGGGKDKDPWGRDQGPPDLDQVLRKLNNQFKSFFGGGGNTGNKQSQSGGATSLFAIVLLALVVYVLAGIYIVKPAERAVVTRFGEFLTEVGPGPHWLPPLIDNRVIVDVEQIESTNHVSQMLTRDENIVEVEVVVQYKKSDPVSFLFKNTQPVETLQQSIESSLRQVVGDSDLDYIITSGRTEIEARLLEQLTDMSLTYQTGLVVRKVDMQPAKAPEEVREAFDDVIKAREEQESRKNKAQAYANQILPQAEGLAKQIVARAQGYKDALILRASGEAQRFSLLLPEYEKARDVTINRLRYQTLEEVFANCSKVILDDAKGGSSSLVYLPLDKMLSNKTTASRLLPNDEAFEQDVINDRARLSNKTQALSVDPSNRRRRS